MHTRISRKISVTAAAVPTLGLVGALALSGLSGCDTVARLTFPDLKFATVHSSGLIPPASSCEGSSGPATLRMALVDTLNRPIHPETTLQGRSVELTRQSIRLSDTALFELPDELCSGMCQSTSASCGVATPSFEATLNRCFVTEELGLEGSPRYVSTLNKNKVFGVLMENTGSLSGSLPTAFQMLYPDVDGDGRGDQVTELLSQQPTRATDRQRRRQPALARLLANWVLARNAAEERTASVYFGAWTFAGSQASLQSLVSGQWTTSEQGARAGLDSIPQTPENQRASVFESAARVLSSAEGFARPDFADHEKTMVLFVDGPDELRLRGQTAQTVIDAAKATNTRVFILHLDPQIQLATGSGNPLIVDDPGYIEAQESPCSDDAECKNFETCRKVTGFSSSPGQNVSVPPEGRRDQTFCMPKRDSNGRFGPIDDYAQIACATGGGYIYLNNAESLAEQMEWLPFVMDGLWEVDVNVSALSRQTVAPGQPYLVQSSLQVTLAGDSKTRTYSQKGTEQSRDNRMVIFAK